MEGLNKLEAQLITHSHGGYQSGDTALFYSGSSLNLVCFHSRMHGGQILAQSCEIQYLSIIAWAGQEDYLVPCSLKLSRHSLVPIDNTNSEGNQCGRNGFIHKGTAHGVLATNSGQLKGIKGSEGA